MSKKIQNSMNSDGKSSGFTLLELLIVISIIAILAILTISNYAGVQRGARLDFAADSVVSLIKEQQQLAKSGNRDEGGNLQCYAFKLIVADEENQAQALIGSSNYVGLPKDENGNILSNPDPGSVDVCEKIEGGGWQERKIFQAGTVLQNISEIINGQELNSLELYFKPPFAQVYRYSEIDDFEPLLSGKFRFVLSFDRGGERERVVELNLQNGQVRRVPNSELNESGLLQSSSNLQLQAVPNVQLQAVPQGNGGLQLQQSPNLQINPQP
jgi:prepilin-type N-terminal cleavage/methylation domain-containing protein